MDQSAFILRTSALLLVLACVVTCSVDGSWGQWTTFSACSKTCGEGVRGRRRVCNSPLPEGGGNYCEGPATMAEACIASSCSGDGNWGQWTTFSGCSKSCGGGVRSRRRVCDSPIPQSGGNYCEGPGTMVEACIASSCSGDGNWGQWTTFSGCSKSCGGGVRSRRRVCDSPIPQSGGNYCEGPGTMVEACNTDHCPVDGSWGQWTISACSKTCGHGVLHRKRVCDSPIPEGGGNYCEGSGTMVEACNTASCPVDGNWGQWTTFSACSKSCGGGVRSRTRECDRPLLEGDSNYCKGLGTYVEACNTDRCPGIETKQRNVTVGGTFSMSCMGEGMWKHIKATNDRHVITRDLDTSELEFLEITSVELSDAGDYYCGQSKKIEVTVLGADADAGAKDVGHILDKAVADIMGAVKAIIKTLKTVASEN